MHKTDGFFFQIYRCWVIHGKRWLIVTPSCILYLAMVVTGAYASQLARLEQIEVGSLGENLLKASTALTFSLNLITTSE